MGVMATMQVLVRFSGEDIERLDEWRRQQKDLPSRPQAIQRLLDLHLPKLEPKQEPKGPAA
jgi:hypothetical protein